MTEEPLNVHLSGSQVLSLRQQAVTSAEAQVEGAKGTEARHYARLQLQKSRRALEAQETTDAKH